MFSTLFDPFINAAYHVVSWLAQLVEPLAGASSTAAAIILFTMAIRALLHPLVRAQIRGEKTRATLAPKVKALSDKHGKNTEQLNKELAKLYGGEGKTMFAGCLPMLIQMPFFSIMYQLFLHTTVSGQPNELLTHTLFGVGLNQTLFSTSDITVHLGLFAVMAAVATWSSIRATRQLRTADQKVPGAALLRFLPFVTIVFAAFVPLAAGLYLLTSTMWATVERAVLAARQVPATT